MGVPLSSECRTDFNSGEEKESSRTENTANPENYVRRELLLRTEFRPESVLPSQFSPGLDDHFSPELTPHLPVFHHRRAFKERE
jgi:hypothetical protein